jgi:hypothetical protein
MELVYVLSLSYTALFVSRLRGSSEGYERRYV